MSGGGDGGAAAESRAAAERDAVRRQQQADQEAEAARAREAERQANLERGRQSIEGAFNGFDDSFYGGVAQRQNEYYLPQLDDQYNKAYRTLVANLSRTGNRYSSSGIRQTGELDERLAQEKAAQSERSRAAANDVRRQVEASRSELNNQLLVSADPSNVQSVGTAASQRANLLASPEALSPLSDVFGQAFRTAGNYLHPDAIDARARGGIRLFNSGAGRDSSSIVNA